MSLLQSHGGERLTNTGLLTLPRRAISRSSTLQQLRRPAASSSAIPQIHKRGAACPQGCMNSPFKLPLFCYHSARVSAENGGRPACRSQGSWSGSNLAAPPMHSPFYPLHTIHCGIAVSHHSPAYMPLTSRRLSVTMYASCGKVRLYIALLSRSHVCLNITISSSNYPLHHSHSRAIN